MKKLNCCQFWKVTVNLKLKWLSVQLGVRIWILWGEKSIKKPCKIQAADFNSINLKLLMLSVKFISMWTYERTCFFFLLVSIRPLVLEPLSFPFNLVSRQEIYFDKTNKNLSVDSKQSLKVNEIDRIFIFQIK